MPDGVAVRAPSDPALLAVDATGLATVPAGMTLRALNPLLWARGWALPNLGDIDAQTVAGAISTGTHGTGARHRGLADQVRALDLVTADGAVRTCSPSENAEIFAAARVGLGALGVLTSVTLADRARVPAARRGSRAAPGRRPRRCSTATTTTSSSTGSRTPTSPPPSATTAPTPTVRCAGGWPRGWATS